MAVNKVVYGNNTLIDLSGDTLAAENMLEGVTGHDKAGNPITGTFSLDTELAAQDTIIAQLQAENTEQKEIITAMEAAIDGKAAGGGSAAVETCSLEISFVNWGLGVGSSHEMWYASVNSDGEITAEYMNVEDGTYSINMVYGSYLTVAGNIMSTTISGVEESTGISVYLFKPTATAATIEIGYE